MAFVPIETPEEISNREGNLNPFPWFERMRESNPVRFDPSRDVWDLFTYKHVKEVLSNQEIYSIEVQTVVGRNDPLSQSMMFSDPPRHDFLRGAADPFFSPSNIDRFESVIRKATQERIEDNIESGTLDVMDDVAFPISVRTIAELQGVPSEDQAMFLEYVSGALQGRTPDGTPVENPHEYRQSYLEYFEELIECRRETPQDGLISHLVNADFNGRSLTDEDLIGFCEMMLVGGTVPAELIANSIYSFNQVDGLMATLAGDREALESAIEEVLRYRSSTQALPRVAKTDTELGGRRIEAGDWIVAWVASANRDGEMFDQPESFIYDRGASDHLAFGTGTHYCLGARLARLEARVVLSELLDYVERIRVLEDDLEVNTNSIILGFESLPIQFDPKNHSTYNTI